MMISDADFDELFFDEEGATHRPDGERASQAEELIAAGQIAARHSVASALGAALSMMSAFGTPPRS